MWSFIIVLYLGTQHYTVFASPLSPPGPVGVVFSSVNLRNVLQWHPGNDTPPNTHFTVQYAIYGDTLEGSGGRRVHWRVVWQCRHVVRSWCDVTNETWDLEQGYYARVRAVGKRGSSKWMVTQRFEPKSDTSFGPPLVSLAIEENSAIISLKGPMRYQPDNHTPEVSMATLYRQMTYEISIHNDRRNTTHGFPVASRQYKYRLLEYDTEYCFSAKTRFVSMPVTCQASAWHCITTQQDPLIGQLQKVVVGIVVPSLCMCMLAMVGYILYHSLRGKGQKRPHMLDLTPLSSAPLTFAPENLNLIFITVNNDAKSPLVANPVQSDSPFAKPGKPMQSYIAQRPAAVPSPEPGAPWENDLSEIESVDYGFVGVDGEIKEEGEEGERGGRSGGGGDRDQIVNTCRANHYFPQKTTHTHTRSQGQSFLPTQTRASRNPLGGGVEGGMARGLEGEMKDREFPSICIKKDPCSGLFHIPLLPQMERDGGAEEGMGLRLRSGMEGKVKGRIDGELEEEKERQRERVPLLSPHASQHIENTPSSHAGQSDYSPDAFAVLRLAKEQGMEEEEEEEEEGTNCVDWDPETGRLVLPEMEMERRREGGLDGWMWGGEEGRESGIGGEVEEEKKERELRLESVLVRQGSEEEREAERGMEADDILTNWSLVIQMDQ